MPSLLEARSSNVSYRPSYIPVAVFVGGTGGIGASAAGLLAKYTEGNIHVIIAGRNRADGAQVLESLVNSLSYHDSEANGQSNRELLRKFVFCDASSITCSFDTVDGLDLRLMMRYYHRFKMAYELMPLLRKARDEGQDAKFLSILASGFNYSVDPNVFGFKNLEGFLKHSQLGLPVQFIRDQIP
ncbi:hypothetical protein BT96DRAFT_974536 [Gymnopus androsaceus JB14]|uniref:Ketoreductase (KR) domain-containing protein n=1 Tax=Gymnopus androsaceus JB14 TaxID=1447944 RepID=A0A6A4HS14_9AGAR|nr:hypothetical protein BT96DRAFT_974536 [Gymnopus androsaceus JB14]